MAVTVYAIGSAQYRFGPGEQSASVTLSRASDADLATLTWSGFDATTTTLPSVADADLGTLTWTAFDVVGVAVVQVDADLATLTWTAADATMYSASAYIDGTARISHVVVSDVEAAPVLTSDTEIRHIITSDTEAP